VNPKLFVKIGVIRKYAWSKLWKFHFHNPKTSKKRKEKEFAQKIKKNCSNYFFSKSNIFKILGSS